MSMALGLGLIALCLLAQAFFSGSELALVSADRVGIRARRDQGSRRAALLALFLEEPERILTTTLIGTNLCVVSSSTLVAYLLTEKLGRHEGWLVVVVLAPLVLVLGEIVPKSLARRYADQLAPLLIQPIWAVSLALFPVSLVVRGVTRAAFRLLGAEAEGPSHMTREELRLLLERRESAEIAEPEREMVRRIFEFPEVTVGDVMRPLIDVTAIDERVPLTHAVVVFKESGFSRVPVFRERVDNIVGVLHALDVVYEVDQERRVATIMRPVTYVPPTQRVDRLLAELQRQRRGLAIVVDEYGGAEGLVTMEDILEEIVGEIDDEHGVPTAEIKRRGEKEWLVSARTPVERLNEEVGAQIPEGDYETISGYLLARLGRIPRAGEVVETEWAVITVVSGDARVIEDVQIVLKGAGTDVRPAG